MGFKAIYINCPRHLRIQRITMRDGGHNEATEQSSAEADIESMRELCDYTITNDGTLDNLRDKVDTMLAYLDWAAVN